MIDTYRKLLDLLDSRERRNASLLFVLMIVMGILEVTGVASIMPFIAVVANPEKIHTIHLLKILYNYLGFDNSYHFLFFLGSVTLFLVIGSLSVKALTMWALNRFTHMRAYTFSYRLLRGCLNQPYPWFLDRNSADLGKSILSEVGLVINGSLMPALQLVSQIVVAVFLIILVIAVEYKVAFTAVFILGGVYVSIYAMLRRFLARIGVDRVRANRERFKIAQEALGGIKDVKILGLEEGYLRSFSKSAKRYARRQSTNQIIGILPKFLLQGIAFGGILAILLALLVTKEADLAEVLPLMALYAFAGSRLLPALQLIYNSLTKLRFSKPALDLLHKDLHEVAEMLHKSGEHMHEMIINPVRLQNQIELRDISYTYPNSKFPALNHFTLRIKVGTTIAIVGSTGAGKTTAADLILGLLVSQRGGLFIDGEQIIDRNIRAWQRNIGYVPQHIFLSDDTVAANIAFGQTGENIDMKRVERAAQIAELHSFVKKMLPDGYQTTVGERGVRLSGGQRQRIGIARALYLDPEVLILDEATSALDNVTEMSVMEAVHNIGHRKTIIIIAHRLTTIKRCDEIHFLENGKIMGTGSYQDLIEKNDGFKEMVRATASSV